MKRLYLTTQDVQDIESEAANSVASSILVDGVAIVQTPDNIHEYVSVVEIEPLIQALIAAQTTTEDSGVLAQITKALQEFVADE